MTEPIYIEDSHIIKESYIHELTNTINHLQRSIQRFTSIQEQMEDIPTFENMDIIIDYLIRDLRQLSNTMIIELSEQQEKLCPNIEYELD